MRVEEKRKYIIKLKKDECDVQLVKRERGGREESVCVREKEREKGKKEYEVIILTFGVYLGVRKIPVYLC